MKRIILIILAMLLMASVVFGASLNLKATWTPNTEPDMAGYNLYRTDGTRAKVNAGLIPHPSPSGHLFTITVPDNSQATLTFVITAVDTGNNESGDSNVASYPFDLLRPAAPTGLSIVK